MATDLLDYHVALNSLLETHTPLERTESVPLAQLNQRILAQDILVQHDVPEFDNSAMDGYAIHGDSLTQWSVVQRIAAGDNVEGFALAHGQAARIFTGAPIPQGTTSVLMQEHVNRTQEPAVIELKEGQHVKAGSHIRRRSEELKKGHILLRKGVRLNPATIGLLAGQGYTHVPCLAQVRITVFSTGNELVQPGQALQPGQIYDSNRIMLISWLESLGFVVIDGGRLADQLDATRTALQRAATQSDAILCSGGVSVGEEDHLKAALSAVGQLIQWRLFIKPGKPFTWGQIGNCRVFMLPGNPVSSLVTFQQLALPALMRMTGLSTEAAKPMKLYATAAFSRAKAEQRREFVRVQLQRNADGNGWSCQSVAQQGSAMLSGVVNAHALAEIEPGKVIAQGDLLPIYPLFNQI